MLLPLKLVSKLYPALDDLNYQPYPLHNDQNLLTRQGATRSSFFIFPSAYYGMDRFLVFCSCCLTLIARKTLMGLVLLKFVYNHDQITLNSFVFCHRTSLSSLFKGRIKSEIYQLRIDLTHNHTVGEVALSLLESQT